MKGISMRNIFLVGKHEIINTLSKRSFWFLSILFPASILFINIIMQLTTRGTMINDRPGFFPGEAVAGASAAGLVDLSGIVGELPPGISPEILSFYPSETVAVEAMREGKIEHFYLIAEDYIESGQVVFVTPTIQAFETVPDQFISFIINYNLTGDQVTAIAISAPTRQVETIVLSPENARDAADPFTFIGPFGIMFIFFFLITMSSGFMLQSVTREKENRVVEVLLVSLNPRQLMLGKILGLGLVGLLQLAIWLGAAFLILGRGIQVFEVASQFQLPPGFLAWGVLFFLAGYLAYASLMAAIGALAPTAREGGQFTFIALLPLMVPIMLNYSFIHYPDGGLAVFLSIFPLTAPTSMMTRMAATSVPLSHVLLSLALLTGTAYLFISLAARFFKSDNLLSDASIQWRRLVS
jgi:ABC-2 type transport system permease protein